MTSTVPSATQGIDLARVQRLDTSGLKRVNLAEAPEEEYGRFLDMMERMLELRHAVPPDVSNNPAYEDYAQVVVKGKVVAVIDNNGAVESSNAVGAQLQDRLPGSVNGSSGPRLAQARAEVIASLLGGTVEKASTALTQSTWERTPKPTMTFNRQGMLEDPLYENITRLKQARSTFLAQQYGQEMPAG